VKIINKFVFLLISLSIFMACETATVKNKEAEAGSETSSQEADLRMVKLDIEGMTCEIGCAKLIQSKLYKTDGVDFAKISFADSSGVVRYDANRLTESDIRNAVEGAGGGDLYRVKEIAYLSQLDSIDDSTKIVQ
jgi:Cu+-exporting ATPase